MRACRTDKGVHAAMQVVSCKLKLPESLPLMVSTLNSLLPCDIRIFDIVRTVNGFQARTFCESRVYEYLLPTFVFEKDLDWSLEHIFQNGQPESSAAVSDEESETAIKASERVPESKKAKFEDEVENVLDVVSSEEEVLNETPQDWIVPESILRQQSAFRLSTCQFERLQSVLSHFEGIHKFHNYTIGKDSQEKNATRQIRSFNVSKPFLIENCSDEDAEGTRSSCEWIKLRVHGNSFMLHQIRKFVGKSISTAQYSFIVVNLI